MLLFLIIVVGFSYVVKFQSEFTTDNFTTNETDSWTKTNGKLYGVTDWVTDCGIQKGHRIFGGYLKMIGYQ